MTEEQNAEAIVRSHLLDLVDDFDARVAANVQHEYGSACCASKKTIDAIRKFLGRQATSPPDAINVSVLREHWLTGVECDHASATDVSTCSCGRWRSEPRPNISAAVESWIEHLQQQHSIVETAPQLPVGPRWPESVHAAGGAWMIVFDDQDVKAEMFSGHGAENAARIRFEQISGNWNAHLFARIATNSRDSIETPTPRIAPWKDFAGCEIRDGDTIRHPDGMQGVVRFLPQNEDIHRQWRVDYNDGIGPMCLSPQIGDKGRAVVKKVDLSPVSVEIPAPRLTRDGWFRFNDGWHPIQRFTLKPGEDEEAAVKACFPTQRVVFRGAVSESGSQP